MKKKLPTDLIPDIVKHVKGKRTNAKLEYLGFKKRDYTVPKNNIKYYNGSDDEYADIHNTLGRNQCEYGNRHAKKVHAESLAKCPFGIVTNKIKKVMHEFKSKKLQSHGKTVKKRKQAVAIALSESRIKNRV